MKIWACTKIIEPYTRRNFTLCKFKTSKNKRQFWDFRGGWNNMEEKVWGRREIGWHSACHDDAEQRDRGEVGAAEIPEGVTRGQVDSHLERRKKSPRTWREKRDRVWKLHHKTRRTPSTSRPFLIPACVRETGPSLTAAGSRGLSREPGFRSRRRWRHFQRRGEDLGGGQCQSSRECVPEGSGGGCWEGWGRMMDAQNHLGPGARW